MKRTATMLGPFEYWDWAQQAFGEQWRTALASDAPAGAAPLGMWGLGAEFWKAAIYAGLDLQLAAAEMSRDNLRISNVPIPEILIGASQAIDFFEDWTNAQMQLWQLWFAPLGNQVPRTEDQLVSPEPHTRKYRVRRRAPLMSRSVGAPVDEPVPA